MPSTKKQLFTRDAERNIAAEHLLSVRQMTAGDGKVVLSINTSATAESIAVGANSKHFP